MNTPIDEIENEAKLIKLREKLKRRNKIMTMVIIGLMVFNVLTYPFFVQDQGTYEEFFITAFVTNVFSFNVIGFVLGFLAALIPYKNLPYKKRYLSASLLILLIIHSMITLGLLAIGIMKLLSPVFNS